MEIKTREKEQSDNGSIMRLKFKYVLKEVNNNNAVGVDDTLSEIINNNPNYKTLERSLKLRNVTGNTRFQEGLVLPSTN